MSNIMAYLISCPWRICFLSMENTALQTQGLHFAREPGVPGLSWVYGPVLESLPGCPDSCFPRMKPPPEALYRTGR